MAQLRSQDDPVRGSPHAQCLYDDPIRSIAPASCIPLPGLYPAVYGFHRHDYAWLSLALAAPDGAVPSDMSLDRVFYGRHTLRWPSMHEILRTAIANGFVVPQPNDFTAAVLAALAWSEGHQSVLRRISAADFEPLPAMPDAADDHWWLNTSYASWLAGGLWHPLCHALGFAGHFWDVASRDVNSRLHLSLVLTQEFMAVSATLPAMLYGDPAIRFYTATMPPPQLVGFPDTVAKLHSMLTIRWGYHHGTPAQLHAVVSHLMPVVLQECPNLRRFLLPAPNVAAQVSAYKMIATLLAANTESHKWETFKYVDQRLANYLSLAIQADVATPPASAEARALLLHTALDRERTALLSAPPGEPGATKNDSGGPASQGTIRALVDLRAEHLILNLEMRLQQVWDPNERRPVDVFRLVFESCSLGCIAILFGNVVGVKGAGPIYSILEQAAAERLNYFTFRLATPPQLERRPDTSLWYSYPPWVDACVRSPDLDTFAKINLFELGAQIRLLREYVPVTAADSPTKDQAFSPGNASYHLSLLEYLSIWFDALGFSAGGPACFEEALRRFSKFCLKGAHYTGAKQEGHILNMRSLYGALVQDVHLSLQCFWSRRPPDLDKLRSPDIMFPDDGYFYGTLRQVEEDIAKVNDLTRLRVSFEMPVETEGPPKRPRLPEARLDRSSGSRAGRDKAPRLGSFAWAVKDEAEGLLLGYTRYNKQLILEKLNLSEADICLPSFLSWKGAEACPHVGKPGHESATSALHTFPEHVKSLRLLFEQPPYKITTEASSSASPAQGHARGSGRGRGKGSSGRSSSGRSSSK